MRYRYRPVTAIARGIGRKDDRGEPHYRPSPICSIVVLPEPTMEIPMNAEVPAEEIGPMSWATYFLMPFAIAGTIPTETEIDARAAVLRASFGQPFGDSFVSMVALTLAHARDLKAGIRGAR